MIHRLSAMRDLKEHLEQQGILETGDVEDDTNEDDDELCSTKFLDFIDKHGCLELPPSRDSFVPESKQREEVEELNVLKKAWKTWPSGEQKKCEFLLPSVDRGKSTTGRQLVVRHGEVYHFWAQFKSLAMLEQELSEAVEALADFDELDLDEREGHKATFKMLSGKEFDEDEGAKGATLCDSVREVAGSHKVVSGWGRDEMQDRIFVRDSLHAFLEEADGVSLQQCTVYCPSTLLERGVELVDSPGSNDSHPLKALALKSSVETASNILVVLARQLEQDTKTVEVLTEGQAFERALRCTQQENNLIVFSTCGENHECLTAEKLYTAMTRDDTSKEPPIKTKLSVGEKLSEEVTKKLERAARKAGVEPDNAAVGKCAEQCMTGLFLLWASLVLDREAAEAELGDKYCGVCEWTRGEKLLQMLFQLRPRLEVAIDAFVDLVDNRTQTAQADSQLVDQIAKKARKWAKQSKMPDNIHVDSFRAEVEDKLKQRIDKILGDRLDSVVGEMMKSASPESLFQNAQLSMHGMSRKQTLLNAFKLSSFPRSKLWDTVFGWLGLSSVRNSQAVFLLDKINGELDEALARIHGQEGLLVQDMRRWLMKQMQRVLKHANMTDEELEQNLKAIVERSVGTAISSCGARRITGARGWLTKIQVSELIVSARNDSIRKVCLEAARLHAGAGSFDEVQEAYKQLMSRQRVQALLDDVRDNITNKVRARCKAKAAAFMQTAFHPKKRPNRATSTLRDCLLQVCDLRMDEAERVVEDQRLKQLKELSSNVREYLHSEFEVDPCDTTVFNRYLDRLVNKRGPQAPAPGPKAAKKSKLN